MFIYRIQILEDGEPAPQDLVNAIQGIVSNPLSDQPSRISFDLHKMLEDLATYRHFLEMFPDRPQNDEQNGTSFDSERDIQGLIPKDWTYPDNSWKTNTGWTFVSKRYGEWRHIVMLSDWHNWVTENLLGGEIPDTCFHVYFSDTTLKYFGKVVINKGRIVSLFQSHKDLNPINQSEWERFPMDVWDNNIQDVPM